MVRKPYSQASENNKQAILQVLRNKFIKSRHVLEIGTGSAQHAVYFSANLQHLTWHTSDREENHQGINLWIDEVDQKNILRPFILDVLDNSCWQHSSFMTPGYDAAFSANTAHIMPMKAVTSMFNNLGEKLGPEGVFLLYGPFNKLGEFTSEGNRSFDSTLRAQDPLMGIRDDQEIIQLATQSGLELIDDIDMPSNNRTLCFRKSHQIMAQ